MVSPLHDPYPSDTSYDQPLPPAPYSAAPSQLPGPGHDGYGGVSTSVYDDFDEEDISGSSTVY